MNADEKIPIVCRVDQPTKLSVLVRGNLIAIVLLWIIVFGIALCLKPYHEDGSARSMETHRQLGMPPCGFYQLTGLPCPSCGMTTSFALLIRGDIWNSMAANWVGTLGALLGLVFIPWGLISAFRGRYLWIRSGELALLLLVSTFTVLMLLRWALVLATGGSK